MSGGHWDYQSDDLLAIGQNVAELYQLISVIEHELDWGICGDTCLACTKLRVPEALIVYFDGDVDAAVAVARDNKQNQCPRCKKRYAA